jgi:hypothetical protein
VHLSFDSLAQLSWWQQPLHLAQRFLVAIDKSFGGFARGRLHHFVAFTDWSDVAAGRAAIPLRRGTFLVPQELEVNITGARFDALACHLHNRPCRESFDRNHHHLDRLDSDRCGSSLSSC